MKVSLTVSDRQVTREVQDGINTGHLDKDVARVSARKLKSKRKIQIAQSSQSTNFQLPKPVLSLVLYP